MELGELTLVCLLACCLVPTASGVCFNGTLSVKELQEMKSKGCSNVGEKLHVKQDQNLVYYLVCSPAFTCVAGTYAFVDVEKCRIICKICDNNHFQPEEMKTDEALLPGCRNEKHRCDQDTKMTCWPNSPEQDDMCRCDWRKGFRPQNDSCHQGCYTESDKSCGLCVKDSTCKEGEELNETYHCVPSMVGVCFNGTLKQELQEMKLKGCSNAGEKLHVQQDVKGVFHLVCSAVFTCAAGTYAYVDSKNCRVICNICEETHFQPEEMKTDQFFRPECRNRKLRCDQDTKMTCWPNSPEQDDMCRCDWRKGFRPQNDSCRHGCYTERDKSCGLCVKDSTCKEGEELNETYHCVPSMVKPCTASQDLNGSSTPAPGVRSATTTAITESTSSPTSSTGSAELVPVSDSNKCHSDDGTWRIVAAVFIVLFVCCIIGVILFFIWKRRKNTKNLYQLNSPPEDPASEPQNHPRMAVGDPQCPEGVVLCFGKRQKNKKGPTTNEHVPPAPGPQNPGGEHIPMMADGDTQHPEGNGEMEALLLQDSGGELGGQNSSTGHGDVATSASRYGGEQKLPVAVTKRCVEVEDATGGTDDDQEPSPTPSSAQSSITGGSSCM